MNNMNESDYKNIKNALQYFSMHFGTYMGIFWILKFPLFPLGLHYPPLILLFFILTMAVPFVGYYFARIYRDRVCGGTINFLNAWIFLVLLYVFASILTAIGHYIYFRYFDNGYIINSYSSIIDSMKNNPMFPKGYMDQAKQVIEDFGSLSPIKIALQLISQNVFYCNLLALVTALFVVKRPK